MTTKIGSQQKQSSEEGIPEGGRIPLHRDTTIITDGLPDNAAAQAINPRVVSTIFAIPISGRSAGWLERWGRTLTARRLRAPKIKSCSKYYKH